MQVLAKYNIMGLGLGLGVAAMAQMRTAQEQQVRFAQILMKKYDFRLLGEVDNLQCQGSGLLFSEDYLFFFTIYCFSQ